METFAQEKVIKRRSFVFTMYAFDYHLATLSFCFSLLHFGDVDNVNCEVDRESKIQSSEWVVFYLH